MAAYTHSRTITQVGTHARTHHTGQLDTSLTIKYVFRIFLFRFMFNLILIYFVALMFTKHYIFVICNVLV